MILAYDVNISNEKKYSVYAARQKDILAFHNSGRKNCQIAMPTATAQKAREAQGAYLSALKRLRLNSAIKCVIRGSCVYLVKIEKEVE